MRFRATSLPDVQIVDLDLLKDERGFFAHSFCNREFSRAGLDDHFVQCNISFNERRGTLRGLHYQADPFPEGKLVRCTAGAIFDVAVDLRRDSLTFGQWTSAELTAENRTALYVPKGCAHGFETLVDSTEVLYLMSEIYRPELARGIAWDDPALAIQWPLTPTVVSQRDSSHPTLAQ